MGFIVVEASLAIRKRWATLVAYLLMYAPISVLFVQLLQKPEMRAFEKIVVPDFGGVMLSPPSPSLLRLHGQPALFFAKPGAVARRRAALTFTALALMTEGSAAIAPPSPHFPRTDCALTSSRGNGSTRTRIPASRV
jgi:hypothetical protein